MTPTITDIVLHDEDGRAVVATLSNGKEITISPLRSLGQETFEQHGGDNFDYLATVDLARACTRWLHGHGKEPSTRRFIGR